MCHTTVHLPPLLIICRGRQMLLSCGDAGREIEPVDKMPLIYTRAVR